MVCNNVLMSTVKTLLLIIAICMPSFIFYQILLFQRKLSSPKQSTQEVMLTWKYLRKELSGVDSPTSDNVKLDKQHKVDIEEKTLSSNVIRLLTFDYNYEDYEYKSIELFAKETRNKAQIGFGNCFSEKSTNTNKLELMVLTSYVPIDLFRNRHTIYDSREPTEKEEEARISEIISAYQKNLNHPHVRSLYVFVEHNSSKELLNMVKFDNSEKLIIQLVSKSLTVAEILLFATKCLHHQIVALLNMDNALGAGFEKVDPSVLIKNNLMYALTRHHSLERYCFHSWNQAVCDVMNFDGSHDAFIFHVKTFPNNAFDLISRNNGSSTDAGIENVLVWLFRRTLNYNVINPCLVLYVHHEHCVPIRRANRRRINKLVTDRAEITASLV